MVYNKCQKKIKITVRTETTGVLPLELVALSVDVVGTVDVMVGFTSVDLVNPEYFGFFPIFTFEVVRADEVVPGSVDVYSVVSVANVEVSSLIGIFVGVTSIDEVILGTEVEVEELDNVELMVDSVSVVVSSF